MKSFLINTNHHSTSNPNAIHRAALKEKPFFSQASEHSFFQPTNHIQRKCEQCEAEDKGLQRMEDQKEEEEKPQGLPVQTKLAIGQPDDKYEKEADEVARKITNQEFKPSIQKEEADDSGDSNNAVMDSATLSSGGNSLPGNVQSFFENKMGHDFSQVRVHTGEQAIQKSEALDAHAFTYGNHIWLNKDQKVEPSFVMAHEIAHVVQQTNPAQHKHQLKNDEATGVPTLSSSINSIQRFIFWNEYTGGGRNNRKGQATHNELENAFEKEGGIQTEIWIPNGNSKGVGFGFDGRPDLYKSSNIIGVTFKQPSDEGVKCTSGKSLGIPGGLNTKKPGRRPSFTGTKKIKQINTAPSTVTVGDIKPAETSNVESGKKQVENYVEGLIFAKNQVNCWSDANPDKGDSPHWNLTKPGKFDDSSLPIPDNFKPSGAGPTRQLGISDFNMVSDQANQRPKTEKVFSPRDLGVSIEGKLFVLHAGGGVVVYYYAPTDYRKVVNSLDLHPSSKKFQGYAEFATELQNKVVLPLTTAPTKSPNAKSKLKAQDHNKSAIDLQKSPKKIQMNKKAKLVDNFKLGQWKKDHQKHQDKFKKQDKGSKEKLHFLELIYKVDKNLKNSGAKIPGSPLPDKKEFEFTLGKPETGKAATKNVTQLFGWMNLWANPVMSYLGTLRDKFGGAFVKVAQFISNMKLKLQDKLDKAKNKNAKKGNSFGAVAVRAFWRAGAKIGGLVFERTIGLLTDSLEKGLGKVISKIIPIDTETLSGIVDNQFSPLKSIERQLETLQSKVKAQIDASINEFDKEIETFKAFADKAEKYGKIIKWAMIALNCATPPGLGCLKVLAKGLIAKMIDKILKWCRVEKKFSGLVLETGWFDTLPAKIAGFTADKVEGLLPGNIIPVFDRSVFEGTSRPSAEDIPCGEQFTAEQMALQELEEELKSKLGTEGFDLLLEAFKMYGVPLDQELTIDLILEIKDKIPDGVTPDQLRAFIASHPASVHQKGEVLDVAEFLNKVKTAAGAPKWYFVAHPPPTGHTKFSTPNVHVTISLTQACSGWQPLAELTIPAKVTKRIWVDPDKKKLFKIFYEANKEIRFDFQGEERAIKKGEEFWGYRPDVCKK